jgi:hypothetical protein
MVRSLIVSAQSCVIVSDEKGVLPNQWLGRNH